jgi:hypothetical protein
MVLLLHQPPSHFDQSLPWVAIEEAASGAQTQRMIFKCCSVGRATEAAAD